MTRRFSQPLSSSHGPPGQPPPIAGPHDQATTSTSTRNRTPSDEPTRPTSTFHHIRATNPTRAAKPTTPSPPPHPRKRAIHLNPHQHPGGTSRARTPAPIRADLPRTPDCPSPDIRLPNGPPLRPTRFFPSNHPRRQHPTHLYLPVPRHPTGPSRLRSPGHVAQPPPRAHRSAADTHLHSSHAPHVPPSPAPPFLANPKTVDFVAVLIRPCVTQLGRPAQAHQPPAPRRTPNPPISLHPALGTGTHTVSSGQPPDCAVVRAS